jgi:hypothetical protein
MSRSTIQTVLACLVALALGAGAAVWHSQSQDPAPTTTAVAEVPSEPAPRPLDPALVTAVKSEVGAKRWLRLVAASEQATAAEMPSLIRLAGKDSAAIRMIAARWAELDSRHMFKCLYAEMLLPENAPNALPSRWVMQEALFEVWAKKDPAAVMKVLAEVPTFSGIESLRMNVVNAFMKSDPEKGIAAMVEWKITNYYPDMKKLAAWAEKEPKAAADAVQKLGAEHITNEALRQVGKAWAATNPQEALEHAATLRPSARASLAGEVIKVWAERDLASAIEFATSQGNAAYRGALGQALVSTWGKTDPVAAMEWTQENLRGPARNEAIASLIRSATDKDVNNAAQLVAGMEPGPAQTRAASSMFETWFGKKDQRSAALNWLTSLPDEDMRRAAFDRVQWNWSYQDPDGVRDFLSGPHGKLAPPNMVSQVARNQAAKNPETAMDWASKLPAEQATIARASVLERWIAIRPEGAQDFARKLPAGAERDNAVRTITQNLAYQSPERAAAWYQSLPAADQKSAKTFLDQIGLATEQRAKLEAAPVKKP